MMMPNPRYVTVEVKGKVYNAEDIKKIQNASIYTARKRMQLYKAGKITTRDLFRRFEDGMEQFTGPDGKVFDFKDITKATGVTPTAATKRLKEWEVGKITEDELFEMAAKEEGYIACSGNAEWKALKTENSPGESLRMSKALMRIPNFSSYELKRIYKRKA